MDEKKMAELNGVLVEDHDFTLQILAMSPEEAVVVLKEKGHDFTVEELLAYRNELTNVIEAVQNKKGELNEDQLDGVVGGCLYRVAAGACVAVTALGGSPWSPLVW